MSWKSLPSTMSRCFFSSVGGGLKRSQQVACWSHSQITPDQCAGTATSCSGRATNLDFSIPSRLDRKPKSRGGTAESAVFHPKMEGTFMRCARVDSHHIAATHLFPFPASGLGIRAQMTEVPAIIPSRAAGSSQFSVVGPPARPWPDTPSSSFRTDHRKNRRCEASSAGRRMARPGGTVWLRQRV
jgi:hypothetical protein